MRNILVLGAGRSSASLIRYLIEHANSEQWLVSVGDLSEAAVTERIGGSPFGRFVHFDIANDEKSRHTISTADIVISLLPAHFHPIVASHCLAEGKHLLTASYVSPEMSAFDEQAREKKLLFLNECGLDPGIDHMTAMQLIDRIAAKGGHITSFESFTGGLIAPDADPENPWRYKFTWNPRNVVMAGQSTAKFMQNGQIKYIPYQQLFTRTTKVEVPGYGVFEGYANRDSLKYIDTYGLSNINTMLRGTLRNEGYCSAWNVLVQLGCCDDSYRIEHSEDLTHDAFINSFLNDAPGKNTAEKVAAVTGIDIASPAIQKLKWSGFFDKSPVGIKNGSPAQIVEKILDVKWKLKDSDRDMVVMWHRFLYELEGRTKEVQASLVVTGENSVYTAMARTVGLPLAIAARLVLNGKINLHGVRIPITSDIYAPVLEELTKYGVNVVDAENDLN